MTPLHSGDVQRNIINGDFCAQILSTGVFFGDAKVIYSRILEFERLIYVIVAARWENCFVS